eukprot:gene11303-30343_t
MTLDNDAGSAWIDCPDPMVTQKNCAADIRSLCNASSMSQKYAMLYAFSPGCHGSTSNITTPVQDIANFLLVRETAPESGIFTREWSKSTVKMDCNTWQSTITMK